MGPITLQPSESIVLFVKPYPYKSSVPAPGLCWIRFRSKGILVFSRTLLSSFQGCTISHLFHISVNLHKAAHPFTKNTFLLSFFFFFSQLMATVQILSHFPIAKCVFWWHPTPVT